MNNSQELLIRTQQILDDLRPRNLMTEPLFKRDLSFAVFAVRAYRGSKGCRKLSPGKVYYLLKGFEITSSSVVKISKERQWVNTLYDDFFPYNTTKTHVTISAIVGQNGSGKSSLVEYAMRLINNLSAVLYGENPVNAVSEHLHYIDKINGELWYCLDNKVYCLTVRNNHVQIISYDYVEGHDDCAIYMKASDLIYDNHADDYYSNQRDILLPSDGVEKERVANNFFYTIVSNSSIYAYNPYDYLNESTTIAKEKSIRGEKFNIAEKAEQCSWLSGLFHKNDGYQVPLVITPWRKNGNIDIVKESSLAKERLISLLVKHEEFTKINDHLRAVGITYSYDRKNHYGYEKLRHVSYGGMPKLTKQGYEILFASIVRIWSDKIQEPLLLSKKTFAKEALEYLVYKTIKISATYTGYSEFYQAHKTMTDEVNEVMLEKLIVDMFEDQSHITRKVYQTLAYLCFDVYDLPRHNNHAAKQRLFHSIRMAWSKKAASVALKKEKIHLVKLISAALVPPPIFRVSINLVDINNANKPVEFDTLSSGEKQQVFAISGILYHLDNINSVKENENYQRVLYRHVTVVMEEIELYYHPELQQQFIHYLLKGLSQIQFENIISVHLIFVTHSPFILSDIPSQNILALKKDNSEIDTLFPTFGANIHEMLHHSFFMDKGSQGLFAQWETGRLMAILKFHKWILSHPNQIDKCPYLEVDDEIYDFVRRYKYLDEEKKGWVFDVEFFEKDWGAEVIWNRITTIDEPVIKKILQREYFSVFDDQRRRQDQIDALKKELMLLEKGESECYS